MRHEGKMTVATVKAKLIDEYEKKKENYMENYALASQSKRKYGGECYSCGGMDHWKRECPRRGAYSKSKDEEVNKDSAKDRRYKKWYKCFLFRGKSIREWLIDSGCSTHMSCQRDWFCDFTQGFVGSVQVANGDILPVEGQGSIKLNIPLGHGRSYRVLLTEVLYVPSLESNLISVKQLTGNGLCVRFEGDSCVIKENNQTIVVAQCVDGLYSLDMSNFVVGTAFAAGFCIHEWHVRLAHRNLADIHAMKLQGLRIKDCRCQDQCISCLKGKMHRNPFPKESAPVENVLDVVVTDVCGPLSIESLGHMRYFITFTDVKSKYCTVFFMKTKNETKKFVKYFVERMKNCLHDKPKILRSDRGGEYLDNELQHYLASEGIKFECTVGYAPQQNGISERKNRTLMEAARTLLFDSGLPKCFWSEAVRHSNYVLNRVINKEMTKTPYECFYGKTPCWNDLYPFGTVVHVLIPDVKRNKLDSHCEEMVFIGIDEQSKGYRVADINRRIVKISREVKFPKQMSRENERKQVTANHRSKHQQITADYKNELPLLEVDAVDTNDNQFCDFSLDFDDVEQDSSESQYIQEENLDESDHGEYIEEDEIIDHVQEDETSENVQEESNSISQIADVHDSQSNLRRSSRTRRLPTRFNDYYLYSAMKTEKFYEPSTFDQAMSCPDSDKWYEAMVQELQSIEGNQTWEATELPRDRRAIGCKWVFKIKFDEKGCVTQYKARLVAQGFSQKFGQDYDEVFAPVASSVTFRLLLSVAGTKGFHVRHFDVKTAFLNGHLEQEIYMRQPPGFDTDNGMVYRLKKSIYGLKQAARVWNETLHRVLLQHGCEQSEHDRCLYILKRNDFICYVLIHVDDLLVSSNCQDAIDDLYSSLSKNFELKNLGDAKQYLGINITRNEGGHFAIDQVNYIEKIIQEAGLQEAKSSRFPLDLGYYKNEDDQRLKSNDFYRKLIGMLLYLSTNTRPDIAASVSILSQKVSHPSKYDLNEVKRLIRYLKGSKDLKLNLSSDHEKKDLYAYSDANFGEDRRQGKSNSGLFIGLNGGALSWNSHKQSVVALSTTEAEYIALCDTAKELTWIRRLCEDFNLDISKTTPIYEDNQSCVKLVLNDSLSSRTKHIRVRYHYTKDLVERSEVELVYCPTELNVADMMTKPLGSIRLETLRRKAFLI